MSNLPLTKKAIFLETHRPRFLCEKVLEDADDGCLDETSHPMNLANQQSQRSLAAPKAMNLTSTGNLRSSQTSFVSSSMIGSTMLDAMELQKLRKDLEDDSTAAGNPLRGSAHSTREEDEDCATNDTASMESMTSKPIRRPSTESITSKPIRRPSTESMTSLQNNPSNGSRLKRFKASRRASDARMDTSEHRRKFMASRRASDVCMDTSEHRSSAGLIGRFLVLAARYYSTTKNELTSVSTGAYANLDKEAKDKARRKGLRSQHKLDSVINDMIQERKGDDEIKDLFHRLDLNGDGFLDKDEFILAYKRLNPHVCVTHLEAMFVEADVNNSGALDLKEVRCPSVDVGTRQIPLTFFIQFLTMVKLPQVHVLGKLSVVSRDSRGLVQVNPSKERFFGEELQSQAPRGVGAFLLSESQHLAMELYESRVASMQRYVAMCVMFHQMGMRVQSFFPKISFGLWGYRMDRTHSSKRQIIGCYLL